MWDYIIVGGGSAGCIIAARLSEDPNNRVLLLNAGRGGLDRMPIVTAPGASIYLMQNPLFDWYHRTEADPSCHDRAERIHNGKTMGGGGSINGMMFIRGAASDFDEWEELGNPGWGYRDVLPYFRKMEHTSIGEDEFHGRDGPVGVEYSAPMLDISHRFIEASMEAGIPYNSDINGKSIEGVTRTPSNAFEGVRQSTARTYLYPARKRPNLTVKSGALARRVLFEGNVAVGVEYEVSGRKRKARARKEVVLCAGGVRSPHLLMLSGVGPAEQLENLGIPLVTDLPGVGKNYMDHASNRLSYAVKLPTWSRELGLHDQAKHGLNWLFRKKGPAASGFSQAVAFVKSEPGLSDPDIQITLLPVVVPLHKEYKDMVWVFVSECKPTGRGEIKLASANPKDAPIISPSLLSGNETVGKAITGIRIARKIMEKGAIKRFVTEEFDPGPVAETDSALEEWVRQSAMSMAHSSGSCKMGQDDMAVVDERLNVRGVENLRVADASIMPTIPSGNINAPTMMIGEKAAALILAGNP